MASRPETAMAIVPDRSSNPEIQATEPSRPVDRRDAGALLRTGLFRRA